MFDVGVVSLQDLQDFKLATSACCAQARTESAIASHFRHVQKDWQNIQANNIRNHNKIETKQPS
uniref:Uncharacterized protein n=1 Tax=Romanomermis culicivorax TaxID=13658 RepID=A0A915HRD7_ROMCU